MNKFFKILLILFLLNHSSLSYSQGDSCLNATQVCFGSTFSTGLNSSGVTAESAYNYDCITNFTDPNWYYMEVTETSGDLNFSYNPTDTNYDIDIIVWGPFTSVNGACSGSLSANLYCDYTSSNNGVVNISGVNSGEIYLINVFNYSNITNQGVVFEPAAGNSSYLQCNSIASSVGSINNESCPNAYDGSANITSTGGYPPYSYLLNGTQYSSGNINNLTAGSYSGTVLDDNFNSSTNSIPTFTITTVNATCPCNASVGNYTVEFVGQSNDSTKICLNDKYEATKLGGEILPPDETGSGNPYYDTIPYNPAVLFLIYTEYPNTNIPCQDDPNLAFRIQASINNYFEVTNDANFLSIISAAALTDNKIYFVPATIYYYDPNLWTVNVMHQSCFDYGTVYEIQFLDGISHTVVSEDCMNDSMHIELNGGYPDYYADNYSISNIQPVGINMNLTPANATPFNVTGFNGFTNYSFDVTDSTSCVFNIDAKYGFPNLDFNYSDTVFCENDDNPSPLLGDIGGGLNINYNTSGNLVVDASGEINISASGAPASGNITIDLTRPWTGCNYSDSINISILETPLIDTLSDLELCSQEFFEPNFTSPSNNTFFEFYADNNPFGIPDFDSGTNFSYYLENNQGSTGNVSLLYYASNQVCTSDTLEMNVAIESQPLLPDSIIGCLGHEYQFDIQTGDSYEWSPEEYFSSTTSPDAIYTFNDNENIYLNSTLNNCTFEDTIVAALDDVENCLPEPFNAFSPNDDGNNDSWVIQGIEAYEENQVSIFNRWGDLVNYFDNYDNNDVVWNGDASSGEELPTGTYFYVIDVGDGNNSKGWVKILK